MRKRKSKRKPERWVDGEALDVMRAHGLWKIIMPGDWIRLGNYAIGYKDHWWRSHWVRARVGKRVGWPWGEGPCTGQYGSNAFYWREVDGWAPKDGFK